MAVANVWLAAAQRPSAFKPATHHTADTTTGSAGWPSSLVAVISRRKAACCSAGGWRSGQWYQKLHGQGRCLQNIGNAKRLWSSSTLGTGYWVLGIERQCGMCAVWKVFVGMCGSVCGSVCVDRGLCGNKKEEELRLPPHTIAGGVGRGHRYGMMHGCRQSQVRGQNNKTQH